MRVMTWNLWWRFGPFEQRLPAIIDTMRQVDADVLCLQEVWSNNERDVADEIAAALDMHAVRTDPVLWNGESFGNAILSRWPIERVASLPIPNAEGIDGHRRVVAASVDTPWGAWPFASTHIDHRFDASAARQLQVQRLLELSSEWRGDPISDLPLIVGADLNAVPDTDEIRLLTGRSPGCARDRVQRCVGAGRQRRRPHVASRESVLGRQRLAEPTPGLPTRVMAPAEARWQSDSCVERCDWPGRC